MKPSWKQIPEFSLTEIFKSTILESAIKVLFFPENLEVSMQLALQFVTGSVYNFANFLWIQT